LTPKFKRITDEAYATAKKLIEANRDKLEIIANGLLEYETLDGVQVAEIVNSGTFIPPAKPPANLEPMWPRRPERRCRKIPRNPCRRNCRTRHSLAVPAG